MWIVLQLAACNTAPLDYRDVGRAPGRPVSWMQPTPWCEGRMEPDLDVVVDGIPLCAGEFSIHPVDDPILQPCAEVEAEAKRHEQVAYLYDGQVARAYTLAALDGREGVHDDLHGIPIFVDF